MPKYYKRKSMYKSKRRTYGKRKSLASKVARLSKAVYKHPNNYKFVHVPTTSITSSHTLASPVIQILNNIGEGSDETNRIGDIAKMQWIDLRVQIYRSGAVANTPATYRVLLIREYTCLGSAISLAQVFNSTTPNPIDSRNVTTRNQHRFHIYYDKTFQLGAGIYSTATTALYNNVPSNERVIHIRRRLKFTTDFSRGNAATVSDIDTNSLYLVILTDNSAINDTNVLYSSNLCFLDN